MLDISAQLRSITDKSLERFNKFSEEDAGRIPAPGKWSKKQILGHLIDSASNNHQKIVRTKLYPEVTIDGYDQDLWVAAQNYQDIPWASLTNLWYVYNGHLASIISRLQENELQHRCKINGDNYVTLDFIVRDYIRHLEHHLSQINAVQV